jgi:hypothetical protein
LLHKSDIKKAIFKDGKNKTFFKVYRIKEQKSREADIMPGDIWMDCVDCGEGFLFSVGEQRFYEAKGLEVPKRCPECREKRKEAKAWT